MWIPLKHEMIGTLRSLLIIVGEIIMTMALTLYSVDATEMVPRPEREKDIEEACEEKEPSAMKTGDSAAGSIIERNEKMPRPEIQPDQMTARQVFAEKVSIEEVLLPVEAARTMAPTVIIISDYRRALEAYLTLVSTLLPEPAFLQYLRPQSALILINTTPVAGCLSFADFAPSLVHIEETSCHLLQQTTQRAVKREPARSLLYPDFRAHTDERARKGSIPDLV